MHARFAGAAAVQSALADLTNIGLGNVTVTGSGTAGDPFVVTFGGGLTDVSVPQIMADSSALVGGGVTTSMVTQGAGDSTVTLDLTTSSDYSLGSPTIDTVFITDNTSTAPTAEASQYSAVTGQTLSVAAAGVLSGASDPGRSALSAVLLAAPTNVSPFPN